MASTPEWKKYAKDLLKAELKARHLTYYELSDRLYNMGVIEFEYAIRNKIGRGSFSAVFLLQCLHAIGAKTLRLRD